MAVIRVEFAREFMFGDDVVLLELFTNSASKLDVGRASCRTTALCGGSMMPKRSKSMRS